MFINWSLRPAHYASLSVVVTGVLRKMNNEELLNMYAYASQTPLLS